MFGSRVGFSGTAYLMVQLSNFKNPKIEADGHLGSTKMAITWGVNGLLIDVVIDSRVQFRSELRFLP